MQSIHVTHLARAASAIANVKTIGVIGLVSMMGKVKTPSEYFCRKVDENDCAEMVVINEAEPQACCDLINGALGRGSSFHERYGYCIRAFPDYVPFMPPQWNRRMKNISLFTMRNPDIYALAPSDAVLTNMANAPDPLVNMEMALNGTVKIPELYERLTEWYNLDLEQRKAIRVQIDALDTVVTQFASLYSADPRDQLLIEEAGNVLIRSLPPMDALPPNVVPITVIRRDWKAA